MRTLLKVSQQTLWQIVGKAATSLSTVVILGLVSRSFKETGTGVFTLALTYLGIFNLLVDFGINAHLLPRFIAGNFTKEWKSLLGFRLTLAFILVVLASMIVNSDFLGIKLWPSQDVVFKLSVMFGLVAIVEYSIFTTASAIFQSRLRYEFPTIITIAGSLVTLGAVTLVVKKNLPLPDLMIGYSAGWVLSGLLAIFFARRFIKDLRPQFDLGYALRTVKEAWPISLALVSNLVYFRLDSFILASVKSFSEVGVYNLSYQIFQSALVVPTFIMNSFFPIMIKRYFEDKTGFRSDIKKALLIMLGISLFATALLQILSPFVVRIVAGDRGFGESANLLKILSLSFPAFFLTSVFMWVLVVFKSYKIMLAIYLTGLIFNAMLNFILIPRFSYFAATWTTVISEYLILILQAVILRRFLKWKDF